MEIYNELFNYFGLGSLPVEATFIDLLQYLVNVSLSVFIVCFIIRSIFLVCNLPNKYQKGF